MEKLNVTESAYQNNKPEHKRDTMESRLPLIQMYKSFYSDSKLSVYKNKLSVHLNVSTKTIEKDYREVLKREKEKELRRAG